MLERGEAGIDCDSCGHQEVVFTADESEILSKSLHWHENGDPICPECSALVTYEYYLED